MYKEGDQDTELEITCQNNSSLSIHAMAPKTSDECWFLQYFVFGGYKGSFSKSFKLAICLNFVLSLIICVGVPPFLHKVAKMHV